MSEFKVGDSIVCTKLMKAEVLTVIEDWPDRYYCFSATSPSSIVLKSRIEYWRQATPEEIAEGHRIDNDLGDDSHIENHISPLCKVEDV